MQTQQFNSPKSFGPFELLEKIGRGGVATVYKARHQGSGKIVAIKMGPRLMALEPANFARFKREFTVIRDLRHPRLVEALDFGEEKNVPYLVQEFVAGESLESRLRQQGPLPVAVALTILMQVAEGVRYLHQNKILHRDIKPGNILLDNQGQAKLGDFGLLKDLTCSLLFTRPHQAMGTLDYGAPEQFEDAKNADFRCDVYSLAATLYTALTGKLAFGSGSHLRILQRKLQSQFLPLRHALPTILPALNELVTNSLNPKPEHRPRDIEEFIAALQDAGDALKKLPAAVAAAVNSPKKSGPDRRTAVRVRAALPAAFVPFHQYNRVSCKATILDVSAGGLCLKTTLPFPLNTVLEIMPAGRGAVYLVEVRWIKPLSEQANMLGCAFVRPLSSGDIESLCPSDLPETAAPTSPKPKG